MTWLSSSWSARRPARLALILACCALFSACARPRADVTAPAVKRVTPTQSGQILDLREGQRLAVHLPDRQPGYGWTLAERPIERILKPLRRRDREKLGAGPIVIIYFDACGPGMTSFAMELVDVKTGEPARERFEMTVRVTY